MRPRRFLFCMTGVGAGNATRELAILRELQSIGDCEIHVAAQGMAAKILGEHFPTTPLKLVSYGAGEFGMFNMVRHNLDFPLRFMDNMRTIEGIMRDFRPDIVLADSDFYCLRPARKLGLRLVALNNSVIVVERIKRRGGLPPNCRMNFNLVEKTDYWIQRRFPQRVLCPTLIHMKRLPRKFVQVPPMVRPEITPLTKPGTDIVVLTGGSGIDVNNIDLRPLEGHRVRMLGTPLTKAPPDAEAVGFTLDVMSHMRHARVLVVQGGFSSVSEAAALRIPTVVVPITNHAEQWVNGQMMEELGIGLSSPSPAEAGKTILRLLKDYDKYLARCQSLDLNTNGHILAAQKLWDWAGA